MPGLAGVTITEAVKDVYAAMPLAAGAAAPAGPGGGGVAVTVRDQR